MGRGQSRIGILIRLFNHRRISFPVISRNKCFDWHDTYYFFGMYVNSKKGIIVIVRSYPFTHFNVLETGL